MRRNDRASGPGGRSAGLRLRAMGVAFMVAGALTPVTDAAAIWNDRFELFVSESVTRDDNVFRLSSAQAPPVMGSSSKGDTYRATLFGFNFDVPVGRQRFTGGLAWNDTRYDRFDFLDLTGHAGQALWLWRVSDDLTGKLGYTESLALASLANVQSGGVQSFVPNALTTRQAFFNAGYRLTPRWELRGEVSEFKQSNELPARQVNDVTVDGGELTVNYVTPAKNKVGFSARVDEARYPNPLQVTTPTPTVVDNAYRQQIVAIVTDWSPTGNSHIIARAGRVSRSYEQLPQRDFEGPTFSVTYDWNPTGNLTLTAQAVREISTTEEVTVGYVVVKGAALRPTLRLREKFRISGTFEYSEREYRGDPGLTLGVTTRTDQVRTAGVTATYRPIRPITLEMALLRETRSSTDAFGDFEANVVRVGARIGF